MWISSLLDWLPAIRAILIDKYDRQHLSFLRLAKKGVLFRDHERLFQPVMDCHMLTAH